MSEPALCTNGLRRSPGSYRLPCDAGQTVSLLTGYTPSLSTGKPVSKPCPLFCLSYIVFCQARFRLEGMTYWSFLLVNKTGHSRMNSYSRFWYYNNYSINQFDQFYNGFFLLLLFKYKISFSISHPTDSRNICFSLQP